MTALARFAPVAILAALAVAVVGVAALPARAGGGDGVVPVHDTKRAGTPATGAARIDEQIGAQVPLDLVFRDENDGPITLGECVGNKPTILVPVYYRCPMLCTKILNGLLQALREMPPSFSAGNQFNVVAVSMDPKEYGSLARQNKDKFVGEYGRPGAEAGCRFLTGTKEASQELLKVVGFRYEFDKMLKEYDHPSGLVILSPKGVVTRYFYGIGYDGEFEMPEGYQWTGSGQQPELTEAELKARKSTDPKTRREFTKPTTTLR
ncbi:MAG: SCO family protein, partial [Gemmataceae bacterium]|nr:SCO family protein [Gemmataceae bacterium]